MATPFFSTPIHSAEVYSLLHPQGVTVISLLVMWKVWVVYHHLSTRDYTRMALADLSGSKRMIGSKPATRM